MVLKVKEKKDQLEKKYLMETSFYICLDDVNLNFDASNYESDVKNMINFKIKTKTYL